MRKFISLFILSFISCIVIKAQTVTIYIVDRDDYNFSKVQTKVLTQKDAETDLRTIVLVHDSYRKEVIGGWGSYMHKEREELNLKKIVKDAIQDLYDGKNELRIENKQNVNSDDSRFDNILGLQWGCRLEEAISKLKTIGISDYEHTDGAIYYARKIFWEGTTYDMLRLEYMTSNKQRKYLTSIRFVKIHKTASESKSTRESIANLLKFKFGTNNVESSIDETGFQKYTIRKKKTNFSFNAIELDVRNMGDMYAVSLLYQDAFPACDHINQDNESL